MFFCISFITMKIFFKELINLLEIIHFDTKIQTVSYVNSAKYCLLLQHKSHQENAKWTLTSHSFFFLFFSVLITVIQIEKNSVLHFRNLRWNIYSIIKKKLLDTDQFNMHLFFNNQFLFNRFILSHKTSFIYCRGDFIW